MAFKKIKTVSKTFNANLTSTPSSLNVKYKKLNQLYLNDNSFIISNNYGLLRQHNLLSLKSNLNSILSYLDKLSFNKFIITNTNDLNFEQNYCKIYKNMINLKVPLPSYGSKITSLNSNQLNQSLLLNKPNLLLKLYPSFMILFNNNSDKDFLSHP
jgi:hypothetical protein